MDCHSGSKAAFISRRHFIGSGAAIVLVLLAPAAAAAQSEIADCGNDKAACDLAKVKLEIAKLKYDASWQGEFFGVLRLLSSALVGLIGGVAGFVFSSRLGRANQVAALDQKSHEARLAKYPELVAATKPLALYFPHDDAGKLQTLTPQICAKMGRNLSEWYFEQGGLLLTATARDRYFALARTLIRASEAAKLLAPDVSRGRKHFNPEAVEAFKKKFLFDAEAAAENWKFGVSDDKYGDGNGIKDFALLQKLSSNLRTALTEDMRSRTPPGTAPGDTR
jgi:hypothetical protein